MKSVVRGKNFTCVRSAPKIQLSPSFPGFVILLQEGGNHSTSHGRTGLTRTECPGRRHRVQYRAENRTRGRFLARIAPARDRPLPPARATFSTQSRFYLSARYCKNNRRLKSIHLYVVAPSCTCVITKPTLPLAIASRANSPFVPLPPSALS